MAADIPAMTDEIRREQNTLLSSRRWLWSPWTWLGGLSCLVTLMAALETRVLNQEAHVADLLRQRGCTAIYAHGWLRKMIPQRWRPSARICGDRVVQLYVPMQSQYLKPIDDLVPELRKFGALRAIQFDIPFSNLRGLNPDSLSTGLDSIRHYMTLLKQAGGVKAVYLSGLRKAHLTSELVQCLDSFEVEHVMLWYFQCTDEEILRLKDLSHLKRLSLHNWTDSANVCREFRKVRPEVATHQSMPKITR